MKTHRLIQLTVLTLTLGSLQHSTLFAQGTAFTYQGRLTDGATPANGSYDLTFALFSVSNGAGLVGSTQTNLAAAVSNGLFTAVLDFGNVFSSDRWLEIGVRTNGGGAFATLSPRQKLTSAPFAIQSLNAVSASSLPTGVSITGTF